jgi:hypothetical protein
MNRLRVLSLAASLMLATSFFGGAVAQAQPQQSAVALGGLIGALVQNAAVLNDVNVQNVLNESLNNNTIKVVELNNVLNGNQINVLTDILNNSEVPSRNTITVRNVLNNNTILTDFLNQNNIAIDDVIAIDILSAPVTIYVFQPR